MSEKRALTPGGFRPKSKVHEVAPGHVLDASSGRLRELDAGGNVIADFGPVALPESKGRIERGNTKTARPKKGP